MIRLITVAVIAGVLGGCVGYALVQAAKRAWLWVRS